MDPFFMNFIDGAATSDSVSEAAHWGPGYPEYKSHLSLRQNLHSKFGDAEHFDVIFTCSPDVAVLSREYSRSRVVVATRKHECRHGSACDHEIEHIGADIIALGARPHHMDCNPT